ncbi:MAG: hypothetical protein M5R40_28150 [Anaerolineae bacterium]|nr:hypothetical protein [Anaerolineae bacterium]
MPMSMGSVPNGSTQMMATTAYNATFRSVSSHSPTAAPTAMPKV